MMKCEAACYPGIHHYITLVCSSDIYEDIGVGLKVGVVSRSKKLIDSIGIKLYSHTRFKGKVKQYSSSSYGKTILRFHAKERLKTLA